MRTKGTAAELERRRRRAVRLVEQGESPAVVARILGVTRSSLHRWRRMARQGRGLAAKPVRGAKRRLTDAQLRELEHLLDQGAPAHGFPNALWTAARAAQVIRRHFGVAYHPDYVRRLLRRRLGWTSHKPQRRDRERDDKEVERWKADEFPRILREAWRRRAHIAFLDESGFLLMPLVRRTRARRGQRVSLRCSAKRDRISAINCVTLSAPGAARGAVLLVLVQREPPRRGGGRLPEVPDREGAGRVDGGLGRKHHPLAVPGGQRLAEGAPAGGGGRLPRP